MTLSALAIAGGVAFLLDRAGHIDVQVSSMLAIALIVIGAVLVLATWVGRARGLIAVGLVLLPIAALAAVTLPFHKGLGQQRYAPTAATEQLVYEYGIGELTIDLRDTQPQRYRRRTRRAGRRIAGRDRSQRRDRGRPR